MKNSITIQDELTEKLKRYDPRGKTYSSLVSRAAKKARRDLIEQGFDRTQADKALQDCYDIVALTKAMYCGAIIKAPKTV